MVEGRPFLIGGRWHHTESVVPICNPYNGETVAHVCQGGAAEAAQAVESSVEGAAAMRRLSSHARATILLKTAQALTARQDEVARLMMNESGKPLSDARREVGRSVQTFTLRHGDPSCWY